MALQSDAREVIVCGSSDRMRCAELDTREESVCPPPLTAEKPRHSGRSEAESPLRLLPKCSEGSPAPSRILAKELCAPPLTERVAPPPYAELDTHEESVCPTFHCRVAKPRRSGCIEAESTDYT
ncbi:hypothetical protein MRX96_016214 [Rhipicephalus microplus]